MSDAEGATEKLRVMVVDDHALFRRGLDMVLSGEPDIELVGEASDGEEAIQKAAEVMPDIVLMDVRMPKRTGIEATAEIKELMPHVKILMLTISDEETDLYDAIKAGASGYLLKEIPIEEVADAIRGVWAGQSRISPSMASKLLTEFAAISKGAAERPAMPAPRLTDREMEVLRLVAQGLNNRDIAKQLYISENTVKNHIRNILEKLHLHSRMEAVVYAVREKIDRDHLIMNDPVYAAAHQILDDALADLRSAVDGASVTMLNRQPAGDDTNPIAVIVTHALHSTRAWLSLATGVEPPVRDRDAEFRTVVDDAAGFLVTADSLAADCRALLETDEAFDPAREGTAPWTSTPDEPITAAWALIHTFEHLGQHTAHAQLTRQILDASATAGPA